MRAVDSGRYGLLREAMRDRWHQPARARYVPGLPEALALDHPAVLGVCLSGAGPSIAMLAAPARASEAAAELAAHLHPAGPAVYDQDTVATSTGGLPRNGLDDKTH